MSYKVWFVIKNVAVVECIKLKCKIINIVATANTNLSWDGELKYFNHTTRVQFVKASDFTPQDVTSPLWHPSHSSLWFRRLVRADVVNEWWFVGNFKVSDVTVTL